jgi:hypothetical protein
MNIISNTCLGAYLTRDVLKEKFSNPFSWNIIDYTSLKFLIENFEKIKDMPIKAYRNNNENFATILLDEKIKIQFVHIKEKCFQKQCKDKNNLFIDDCVKYAKEKFIERLSRMNNDPVFILQVQPNHKITGNLTELKSLLKVKSNYPIIIISKENLKTDNKAIFQIRVNNSSLLNMPEPLSKHIAETIKKISKFHQ